MAMPSNRLEVTAEADIEKDQPVIVTNAETACPITQTQGTPTGSVYVAEQNIRSGKRGWVRKRA